MGGLGQGNRLVMKASGGRQLLLIQAGASRTSLPLRQQVDYALTAPFTPPPPTLYSSSTVPGWKLVSST